jgi:hypothetical protein
MEGLFSNFKAKDSQCEAPMAVADLLKFESDGSFPNLF